MMRKWKEQIMKGKMAVLLIFCALISGCSAANEDGVSSSAETEQESPEEDSGSEC